MKSWIVKILGAMSLTCLLAAAACSSDDGPAVESGALPEDVPASVYEDFRVSFPNAENVRWSVADGYAVVTFTRPETRSAAGETSVWYELKDAQKKMQCRTIAFEALPEAVRAAFAESEYGADAADATAGLLIRYTAGTVENIYVLRVTTTGDSAETTKTTLYYTVDGVLVKLTAEVVYDGSYADLDPDYRDWLPRTSPEGVAEFVSRNYPRAEYLYIYEGRELTKVKILDGRQARLLLFDAAGNWLSTQTQLHADELPEEILAAFRASDYADRRIDSVEEYLTADDEHYYVLTVKDRSGKQEIRINEDGMLDDGGDWNTPGRPGDGEQDAPAGGLSEAEVDAFIRERYPEATVVSRSQDDKELEVKLSANGAKIEVRFELRSQGYLWTESEWDLEIRDAAAVPAPVQATIDASYAGYRLTFLKYVESASGENYYEAGLKSEHLKQTVKVKMDEQGGVLAEYGNR
ncbi:MAG: PepSY-like domain-containing protein [Alistipes sp.]|nr:PepSY-like domain-containing protein [Alistipes sp.]